jgi:hypothetical protein
MLSARVYCSFAASNRPRCCVRQHDRRPTTSHRNILLLTTNILPSLLCTYSALIVSCSTYAFSRRTASSALFSWESHSRQTITRECCALARPDQPGTPTRPHTSRVFAAPAHTQTAAHTHHTHRESARACVCVSRQSHLFQHTSCFASLFLVVRQHNANERQCTTKRRVTAHTTHTASHTHFVASDDKRRAPHAAPRACSASTCSPEDGCQTNTMNKRVYALVLNPEMLTDHG